ncbi:unnamed protein product [Gongylonema pulchrum]|uniref:Epoxide hydrolase n=1 Tax=Gongylonema pulchrum TaxID=637853 RepID=A0A183DVB3_9BILA|nr:unnamed protein product [Gongylonema pulchrum]
MGYFLRFFLAAFVAFIAFAVYSLNKHPATDHPTIAADGWFGSGKKRDDDERIMPVLVNVSSQAIEVSSFRSRSLTLSLSYFPDLKYRLRSARISYDPLEDEDNFQYGFNSKYLRELTNYWLNKYNWRYHEAIINTFSTVKYARPERSLPQGAYFQVHFIHMKPARGTYKVVVPLLLVHGWPSNVFEFYKIIPMLVDPVKQLGSDVDLAFEVVAPSIPGFAWSSAPKKTGFNTEATARIFWKLMTRLGFSRFLLQGGDWGSPITTSIALYFPQQLAHVFYASASKSLSFLLYTKLRMENLLSLNSKVIRFSILFVSRSFAQRVIGLHLNMAMAISWKAMLYQLVGLVLPKLAFSSETFHHFSPSTYFMDVLQETGYLHIQATKPDTVGMFLGCLNALRPQLIPAFP